MKDVGESGDRNNKFKEIFNRDKIIQSCVKDNQPIIFDIGAHEGQSREYLENIFTNPILYSFEPDPSTFKTLNKKASDKNKIFNLAFLTKMVIIFFIRIRLVTPIAFSRSISIALIPSALIKKRMLSKKRLMKKFM